MSKSLLITFEGIDGCGKSTQAKKLVEYLDNKNLRNKLLREPGSNPIAEEIRSIILKKHTVEMFSFCELFLYEASRAQLVEKQIKPLLKNGEIVILDRFFDSTTAYQGFGREIDPKTIDTLNKIACQDIEPDLTFYLHLDSPSAGFNRINSSNREKDRIEEAGDLFFKKVINGYVETSKKYSHRFITLDAQKSIDDLNKEIINIVKQRLL